MDGVPKVLRARLQAAAGQPKAAESALRKAVKDNANEFLPLAHLCAFRWQQGRTTAAQASLRKLRELSAWCDGDIPAFRNLAPVAASLGWHADWRVEQTIAEDVGSRPELDSLGPRHWQPGTAPSWELLDAQDKLHRTDDLAGQNYVLILYLGLGCLHCVEQLEAFTPQAEAFQEAGWKMLAIGTDSRSALQEARENYDKPTPFPLLCDPDLKTFRSFRCYDDFEDQPLHGTFLIDAQGRVRWQDIGHEPFTDHAFLLREAQRIGALAQ